MRLGLVLLAVALTACGGPTGPERTLIHFNNFRVGPRDLTYTDFTPAQSGTLIVVVDWTFPSNSMITALSTPSCDFFTGGHGCGSFFAQSRGRKPAEFRYAGTIAGQAYRTWVANEGAQPDSGVINVYLER